MVNDFALAVFLTETVLAGIGYVGGAVIALVMLITFIFIFQNEYMGVNKP
jgi:hypothetical protein